METCVLYSFLNCLLTSIFWILSCWNSDLCTSFRFGCLLVSVRFAILNIQDRIALGVKCQHRHRPLYLVHGWDWILNHSFHILVLCFLHFNIPFSLIFTYPLMTIIHMPIRKLRDSRKQNYCACFWSVCWLPLSAFRRTENAIFAHPSLCLDDVYMTWFLMSGS